MREFLAVLRNVHRIAPGPLLLRGLVLAAGVAALVLAVGPDGRSPASLAVVVVGALLVAVIPGSWLVTGFELVVLVSWVATTSQSGVHGPTMIALALLLYLQHTACALAAAVPIDAVVLPSVLLRWFARTGGVMLLTVILGVVAITVSERLQSRPDLVFPLVGLAAAIATVGVLTYLWRRRAAEGP